MSDTPETDANVASLTKAPDCFCEADHARRLERQRDEWLAVSIAKQKRLGDIREQRDAYAETIREFLRVSDECADDRRGFMRLLKLADEIDERYPELAVNAFMEQPRAEKDV